MTAQQTSERYSPSVAEAQMLLLGCWEKATTMTMRALAPVQVAEQTP